MNNLRNGMSLKHFVEQEVYEGQPDQSEEQTIYNHNRHAATGERVNRFFDDLNKGPRSLSTDINNEQKKRYNQLFEKSLKRERSSLSHTRYNKMKTIILKEVRNAI
jgi:hypothetical protein